RRIGRGQRMRPHPIYTTTLEREADECRRRLRRVPLSLVIGSDSVGDLDYARVIWRPLETSGADDQLTLPVDDRESMYPRVWRLGLAESGEPGGRDVIRPHEVAQALRGRQAN